ncbi:centlein-like [Rhincodon typus]|uniref:centlein-like n=1 Tax=Rhincodon typus TaxID=259920 RepID=UPI00202F84B0|nr:centlein-like [Rhincodon typus]
MASTQCDPRLLLEDKVRKLSEDLAQCQADKEFVWSLWKRLQVANPDLTQAISLVLERRNALKIKPHYSMSCIISIIF